MEWIKKHKKVLLEIYVFVFFFVVFFLLNTFRSITSDEIWCYGFSYNISRGLTIYKDFNVVPTPFSFFIGSLFIKFIGPYFLSISIFNSILVGIMGVLLYRMISWKSIFAFVPVFFITPSPYNLLCLFFLILILYLLRDDKYEDWIALIVGLIFMTKQNIGVLLFLPMFFYSKKKIRSTFIFLIPFFVISIYLAFKGAFFDFIDYSFLGLFDFQQNNTKSVTGILLFEVVIVSYLVYCFIKSKFKDKEVFYILTFQIMTYPIMDQGHFFVSFMPVFYYFAKKVSMKTILYPSFLAIFLFCCCYYQLVVGNVHMGNDFMFMRAPDKLVSFSNEIYDYFDHDVSYVYSNSEMAYFLKLLYDVPIGKFDLLNSGNLGRDKKQIFEELRKHCSKETCYFLMFDDAVQFETLTNLVETNYTKIDSIKAIDVYVSRKD